MNKNLVAFLAGTLAFLLKQASPQLKAVIAETYGKLKEAAKKSPSPLDDVLVSGLGLLLGLDE